MLLCLGGLIDLTQLWLPLSIALPLSLPKAAPQPGKRDLMERKGKKKRWWLPPPPGDFPPLLLKHRLYFGLGCAWLLKPPRAAGSVSLRHKGQLGPQITASPLTSACYSSSSHGGFSAFYFGLSSPCVYLQSPEQLVAVGVEENCCEREEIGFSPYRSQRSSWDVSWGREGVEKPPPGGSCSSGCPQPSPSKEHKCASVCAASCSGPPVNVMPMSISGLTY